ncbi:MAG TPA: hypothetical protein PLO23_04845 [Alphaproteobacteria bacterium]|nr:hypothetical protein [Alphaproteobacteria bacterium]
MPHIIVEYSPALEPDIPFLLASLHETLAAQGVPAERIKARGYKIEHAVVANKGPKGTMLHATVLLLEGRDIPTRKAYGEALYAALKTVAPDDCATTLEMRDMTKETYSM